MKQLYYLSAPGDSHRWDDLCTSLDVVISWRDIENIKSLTAFVTREKSLYQQDFLLMELESLPWSPEHILSAVQMLRRFFAGHLIFIAPRSPEITQLYGMLADQFRVHALFYRDEAPADHLRSFLQDPYAGKIHAVLSAVREGVATQAAQTVSPFRIPPGMVLTVAVLGSMPRCGATTQTIAIYHYLSSLGFSPAIIDATGQSQALADFYGGTAADQDGCLDIHGVLFAKQQREGINAYIVDAGVYQPTVLLPRSDLVIIVGGAKPWELPPLATALATLKEGSTPVATLVSFSTEGEMRPLVPYLGEYYAAVAYHPNFMEPAAPGPYQKAILPCLKRLCGDRA